MDSHVEEFERLVAAAKQFKPPRASHDSSTPGPNLARSEGTKSPESQAKKHSDAHRTPGPDNQRAKKTTVGQTAKDETAAGTDKEPDEVDAMLGDDGWVWVTK